MNTGCYHQNGAVNNSATISNPNVARAGCTWAVTLFPQWCHASAWTLGDSLGLRSMMGIWLSYGQH